MRPSEVPACHAIKHEPAQSVPRARPRNFLEAQVEFFLRISGSEVEGVGQLE